MSESINETPVYPELQDFEIDVFNALTEVMDTVVPQGNFRSEAEPVLEDFPVCVFYRDDSFPDWRRESTSDFEDYTIETYRATAYALSMDKCRKIMNVLSERLRQMNFRRLSMRPVPNLADNRIKRIEARFEIKFDNIGQMYRT